MERRASRKMFRWKTFLIKSCLGGDIARKIKVLRGAKVDEEENELLILGILGPYESFNFQRVV